MEYINDKIIPITKGYLSSNNFKIHQKWRVVNTSLKLLNPRNPLKMVCLIPLILVLALIIL